MKLMQRKSLETVFQNRAGFETKFKRSESFPRASSHKSFLPKPSMYIKDFITTLN